MTAVCKKFTGNQKDVFQGKRVDKIVGRKSRFIRHKKYLSIEYVQKGKYWKYLSTQGESSLNFTTLIDMQINVKSGQKVRRRWGVIMESPVLTPVW